MRAVLFLIAAATLATRPIDRRHRPHGRIDYDHRRKAQGATQSLSNRHSDRFNYAEANLQDGLRVERQRVASQSAIDEQARQEYQRQIDLFRRQQKRDGEN